MPDATIDFGFGLGLVLQICRTAGASRPAWQRRGRRVAWSRTIRGAPGCVADSRLSLAGVCPTLAALGRTNHRKKTIMPEWALVIVLILGVPILVGVWLIVRAVKSGQRIEELARRVGELELEFFRLKKEPPAVPVAQPITPA